MTNGGSSAAVVLSPGDRGDSDKTVKVTLPDNQVCLTFIVIVN